MMNLMIHESSRWGVFFLSCVAMMIYYTMGCENCIGEWYYYLRLEFRDIFKTFAIETCSLGL